MVENDTGKAFTRILIGSIGRSPYTTTTLGKVWAHSILE